MKRMLMMGLAIVFAMASVAGGAELPPGKWWNNPQIAQRLQLEPAQQTRLDAIFRESANDLIDRRAEIEKLTIAVRGELDQPQLNRQNLQRLAGQLTQARGRLFERELMMLVDMRGVLSDEQWNRLRSHIDRRQAERGMQQQQPGQPRPGQQRPRRRP
jgi:hypothetical protein